MNMKQIKTNSKTLSRQLTFLMCNCIQNETSSHTKGNKVNTNQNHLFLTKPNQIQCKICNSSMNLSYSNSNSNTA